MGGWILEQFGATPKPEQIENAESLPHEDPVTLLRNAWTDGYVAARHHHAAEPVEKAAPRDLIAELAAVESLVDQHIEQASQRMAHSVLGAATVLGCNVLFHDEARLLARITTLLQATLRDQVPQIEVIRAAAEETGTTPAVQSIRLQWPGGRAIADYRALTQEIEAVLRPALLGALDQPATA